jgi:hypothetical protein
MVSGWTGLEIEVRDQEEAGGEKFVYSYKLNLLEPFVDGFSRSHSTANATISLTDTG